MLKNTEKEDSYENKERFLSYTKWLESQQDSEVDSDDDFFC